MEVKGSESLKLMRYCYNKTIKIGIERVIIGCLRYWAQLEPLAQIKKKTRQSLVTENFHFVSEEVCLCINFV